MTVPTNNEEVEALANVLEAAGTDWESRTEQGQPTKPLADELATAVLEWLAARRLPVSGDTSDGHHTFDELYDYRMLYNAHAAQGWLADGVPVVKSWRHSDGELAFGGGWFVVSAQLTTGQITNHYKAEHWDLFDVPEVEQAPAWDGHTPAIAAERLRAALSASQPREAALTEQGRKNARLLGDWLAEHYPSGELDIAVVALTVLKALHEADKSREAAPSDTDRFKPTHRVRERGSDAWIDVRADGVEPQTYYDRDGRTIYAGIWFRDMEVERITSHPVQVEVTDDMVKRAVSAFSALDDDEAYLGLPGAESEQFLVKAILSAALGGGE